jgi:sulfatase maturation enzyme AslB (radical SAM superfamily)
MRKRKKIEEVEIVDHWCKDCKHADMKRHKCQKNDIILNKKSHYDCSSYEKEEEEND